MMFTSAILATGLLASAAIAAPAGLVTDNVGSVESYPFSLPAAFPTPSEKNLPVPTHFALFAYSLDLSIKNETLFSKGVPHNKNAISNITHADLSTFGSWTFGIGPHKHLFAYSSGKIATLKNESAPAAGETGPQAALKAGGVVQMESWKNWWTHKRAGKADALPTCQVIPGVDVLFCHLGLVPFKFAKCEVEGAEVVSWGTLVGEGCKEIVIHVKEVPKTYGNQNPDSA